MSDISEVISLQQSRRLLASTDCSNEQDIFEVIKVRQVRKKYVLHQSTQKEFARVVKHTDCSNERGQLK